MSFAVFNIVKSDKSRCIPFVVFLSRVSGYLTLFDFTSYFTTILANNSRPGGKLVWHLWFQLNSFLVFLLSSNLKNKKTHTPDCFFFFFLSTKALMKGSAGCLAFCLPKSAFYLFRPLSPCALLLTHSMLAFTDLLPKRTEGPDHSAHFWWNSHRQSLRRGRWILPVFRWRRSQGTHPTGSPPEKWGPH